MSPSGAQYAGGYQNELLFCDPSLSFISLERENKLVPIYALHCIELLFKATQVVISRKIVNTHGNQVPGSLRLSSGSVTLR